MQDCDPTGALTRTMRACADGLEQKATELELQAEAARDAAGKLRVVIGLVDRNRSEFDQEYGAVTLDGCSEYGPEI